MLDAIERVEIALRTQIAYHWAQYAGCTNPQGDKVHYNQLWTDDKVSTLLKAVQNAFDRSHADFVKLQKSQGCTDVKILPVWMFVELTTMGELTRIYKGLDYSLQETIADKFGFTDGQGKIDTEFFYSLMSLFQLARNACAHHARIWNVEWNQHYPQKTKQGIMYPPVVVNTCLPMWNQWWIESQNAWMHKVGKHSFQRQSTAFLLTACAYFTNKVAPNSSWKQRFVELINRSETPSDVLKVMKFRENWRSHPFWNV